MRYIGIITLLVLCLTLLLLTGCMTNTVTPEIASGNLENEDTEELVIEDTGETKTVYPQKWATGDGTVGDPWANDCIETALTNAPTGGTIFLKAGYYILSDVVTITKKINIIGEGMGKTIITTANANGFFIDEVDYVSIKNLTIDGDAQTDGQLWLSCISIANSDYVSLEDIEVKNAGYYGIDFFQNNHSLFQNIHAHDNYIHGLHPVEEPATEEPVEEPATEEPVEEPATEEPVEEPATEEPGTVEVDTTKPVITGSRAPLPNSFGWNNTDVTVSFSCADTGAVQSSIAINTVAGKTVTTEGKNQSVTNTGVCTDAAGNTADPVTVSNIHIDKTLPEVTITLPGTGEYVLNQSITATWSATDALSGVVAPVSGSVSIDTSSVGTKTFTLPAGTAMDKAGNSSLEVTKSYSVIADTEEPVIVDSEDPEMVYPQKWATGDGTAKNPWANNCLNSALTNVPVGGTIFLKAGYYTLSTLLNINKTVNIIGEGRNKTIIVTSMTNTNGIYTETDYVTLKGFTIDGNSLNDNYSLINIQNSDYIVLEDIEAMNAGYYGINIYQVNHSLFQNIYAHDNYRHGLHPGSDTAGRNKYNTYRDIYAWNNGADGIDARGISVDATEETNDVYDNIHCWDNGENGINISFQSGAILSNSTASGNGRNGMNFHTLNNFSVNSCSSTLNGERGIYLINSKNVNFTNVIVKNSVNNGIALLNSSDIVFTSCQSYDDRVTLIQRYGIELKEGCSEITVLNCKLTPNKVGDIDNSYSVASVVITEKMLAKF
jgi:hypothetical protein